MFGLEFFPDRPSINWTSHVKEASLADIGKGPGMDDTHQDLVNHLFAVATAMLEDAIEIAAAGQGARLTPSHLAVHGRQLGAALRDVAVIADAITIVSSLAQNGGPKPPKMRR